MTGCISSHQVLNLAADVLKRVPELIDYEGTAKLVADDMSPLNVVLLQEVHRLQCTYSTIHVHYSVNTVSALFFQLISLIHIGINPSTHHLLSLFVCQFSR